MNILEKILLRENDRLNPPGSSIKCKPAGKMSFGALRSAVHDDGKEMVVIDIVSEHYGVTNSMTVWTTDDVAEIEKDFTGL